MRKHSAVTGVAGAGDHLVHGGYSDGTYQVGYHGGYQRSLKLPQTTWMHTELPMTTITPIAM